MLSSNHVLFSFRRCPYAIRARLILTLIEEPFDLVEVSLKNKPQKLLDLSPKGTVPVLSVLGQDKEIIDESLEIIFWALKKRYPKNWEALSEEDQKKAEIFQSRLDSEFIPNLNAFKYSNSTSDKELAEIRNKLVDFLVFLDHSISSKSSIFKSESWIDISFIPFIRQLSKVDSFGFFDLNIPKVFLWLKCWLEAPCMLSVMHKN